MASPNENLRLPPGLVCWLYVSWKQHYYLLVACNLGIGWRTFWRKRTTGAAAGKDVKMEQERQLRLE